MGMTEPAPEPPYGDDWWPEADSIHWIGTPSGENGIPDDRDE